MSLPRHSSCQEGFSRSGRAHKQGTLRQLGADPRIFLRIMKEIHNFHQRFLCFILSGHVRKSDSGLLLNINLGVAFSDTHDTAAAAHTVKHKIQQANHKGRRQYPAYNKADDAGTGIFHTVNMDAAFQQAVRQIIIRNTNRIILGKPGIIMRI